MNMKTRQGANPDAMRKHNLSMVMRAVHDAGHLTRSELTRSTGLSRSTILNLVNELDSLGLVNEHVPGRNTRAGRPSPIVMPSPDVIALAINPEIDATVVTAVGLDRAIRGKVYAASKESISVTAVIKTIEGAIAQLTRELPTSARIVAAGVAVPGVVRSYDNLVRWAPHLQWVDADFAGLLSNRIGLPTKIGNDANLGALAERLFGAGHGHADVVYLNGGPSGIGAGVILDGHLLHGASGYAGELGHTLVNSGGVRCRCGSRGCLESEVTRAGLLRALRDPGLGPDEIQRAVMASGRAAVRAEVDRQRKFLAVALGNIANTFNPEVIVLGGFLRVFAMVDPPKLASMVRRHAIQANVESLRISPASLSDEVLSIGAAEYAFEALLSDPAGVG